MLVSEDIAAAIKSQLGNLYSVKPVSGGSINHCYQIRTDEGIHFLKVNSVRYPDFFLAEAEGLKQIRKSGAIAVPVVIAHGRARDEIFLILSWVDSGDRHSSQSVLGKQVAKMHRNSAEKFGLDHSSYIGSLPQTNQWNSSWHDFFACERIVPQLKIATDKRLISKETKILFSAVLAKLHTLYPPEAPSLIHGDLWSGNYMVNSHGTPVLIDPAAYFGNREADIAMTTLFGGFTSEFYDGYNDEFPLQPGWEGRLDIWNLYPLLVHLNLFGSGYLGQIIAILKKFT